MSEEKPKLTIPLVKSAPSTVNPVNLIIFSKPKIGKTESVAQLEDTLILDFEKGSKYVEAMKIEISNIAQLREIGKQIKEAGFPYKRLVVDTITSPAYEKMVSDLAEEIYSKTLPGKNWFKSVDGKLTLDSGKAKYGNILGMPEGAGYRFLWQSSQQITEYLKTLAPELIQLAHIKDSAVDKATTNLSSADLDISGKLKRIVTGQADAIGYLYRKGNQNILTFKSTEDIACGARPKHLSNAEIVLSEKDENGVLTTHWDKIYLK